MLKGAADPANNATHPLFRAIKMAGRSAAQNKIIREIKAIDRSAKLPNRLKLDRFIRMLQMCEDLRSHDTTVAQPEQLLDVQTGLYALCNFEDLLTPLVKMHTGPPPCYMCSRALCWDAPLRHPVGVIGGSHQHLPQPAAAAGSLYADVLQPRLMTSFSVARACYRPDQRLASRLAKQDKWLGKSKIKKAAALRAAQNAAKLKSAYGVGSRSSGPDGAKGGGGMAALAEHAHLRSLDSSGGDGGADAAEELRQFRLRAQSARVSGQSLRASINDARLKLNGARASGFATRPSSAPAKISILNTGGSGSNSGGSGSARARGKRGKSSSSSSSKKKKAVIVATRTTPPPLAAAKALVEPMMARRNSLVQPATMSQLKPVKMHTGPPHQSPPT